LGVIGVKMTFYRDHFGEREGWYEKGGTSIPHVPFKINISYT
jgi:hypothetical protein